MTEFAALEQLFRSVLRLSMAAAIVIPLVLLVRAILGNRRDPRLFHFLWIAVALRLLVPWSPPPDSVWRIAVPGIVPGGMFALSDSGYRPAGSEPDLRAQPAPSTEPDILPGGASSVDWLAAAGGVWLAGTLAVAVLFAAAHWRFRAAVRREAAQAGGDEQELRDILDACRAELGIRIPVGLRITSLVSSPAVVGMRKPVILIPRQLVGRLGRGEWTCVFAHELTHARRRDALWNTLMAAFAAAHWFNPLAWAAFRAMREDQELACDAALARHVNPVEYGRTLTRVAELQSSAGRFAAIPFLSGRKNLTLRRMEMLFLKKRTALTLLVAVCIAALSSVIVAAPDPGTGSAASDPEVSFIVPVHGTITFVYGEAKKYNVNAISITAEEGTPVYAVADGIVTRAGYETGDGNRIAIAHDGDYESVYNHLLKILVMEGARVKQGQMIGKVGSTGRSTGPHLSFELLRGGEFIDPESVIEFDMPRRNMHDEESGQ